MQREFEHTVWLLAVVKLLKNRHEGVLEAAREEGQVTFIGTVIRLTAPSQQKRQKLKASGLTSSKY